MLGPGCAYSNVRAADEAAETAQAIATFESLAERLVAMGCGQAALVVAGCSGEAGAGAHLCSALIKRKDSRLSCGNNERHNEAQRLAGGAIAGNKVRGVGKIVDRVPRRELLQLLALVLGFVNALQNVTNADARMLMCGRGYSGGK